MFIRFIVYIVLIYAAYKVIKLLVQPKQAKVNSAKFTKPLVKGEDLVEDPVCHTYIPVSQALKMEKNGQAYFFCSEDCRQQFNSPKSKDNL